MNTAGCTTGWVNYANAPSQAALERSSQHACEGIRLTRSKAAVWTVGDGKGKGKGSPYSVAERRVPELIPILGSQPAGDVSQNPAAGCHFFSPGPQLPSRPVGRYQFRCW